MFVDPKNSKATLKKSERDLLDRAKVLLDQLAKFTDCEDAKDASQSIVKALAKTAE